MASETSRLILDIIARDKASKDLLKTGALIAGLGLAVGKFAKDSVEKYAAAQQAEDRLAFAYKKFAQVGDVSLASLNKLAEETQKKTIYDHLATQASEAQLAAFKLTGRQIETMIPLVQDLASAQGVDLGTATTEVGKALLGQGRGLKSVGIAFKDTKTLAGNLAEVQQQLNEKVGGFAENQGKTAAGQAEILANQYQDLQEQVGSALVPALTKLVEIVNPLLEGFNSLSPAAKDVALGVGFITVAGGILIPRIAAIKVGLAEILPAGLAARAGLAVTAEGEAAVGGAMFGPVGLIAGLGLAAAAALLFASRTSSEVKPLGEVAAALGETKKAYLDEVKAKILSSVVTTENIPLLQKAGISIDLVTAALGGNKAAQSQVNTLVDAAIAKHTTLTGVLAGGKGTPGVRKVLDSVAVGLTNLKGPLGDVNGQLAADTAQWNYLHNAISRVATVSAATAASLASTFGSQVPKFATKLPPHRAAGGPVMSGATYLVGERGPEVFTAPMNGRIIPNVPLRSSGAGVTNNYNLTIHTNAPVNGQAIIREIQAFERRSGARWRAA